MKTELIQKELEARALIAGDLFREGKVTRPECFRVEMDAALGEDTGDIQYENNDDHKLIKCHDCGKELTDRQSRDVGICLPCFAIRHSDFDEETEN